MTFSLEPVVLRLKRADWNRLFSGSNVLTPLSFEWHEKCTISLQAQVFQSPNFSNLWAACFMKGALASPWFGNDWNA